MPATLTFGHYGVLNREDGSLHELGRGAMGITYKGFDTHLRCSVALKVINPAKLDNERARQRFVGEARKAAKLKHPNIAGVFHLGEQDGNYFYAMEFIDGETLEARVRRDGPLPAALALQIASQVARALNAASTLKIIHRDIKPANLMLVTDDDELVLKVIDFGLAKSVLSEEGASVALTMQGFIGTVHYAAPEQIDTELLGGEEIDSRADIYALGCTLWFMLNGQPPFRGSVAQVITQQLNQPPPFHELQGVPEPVIQLLKRMLEKDRNARPQTAAKLRHDINDCLQILERFAPPALPSVLKPEIPVLAVPASTVAGESRIEPGATVGGRYAITSSLRESDQGKAFRARDLHKDRDVMLHELPPDVAYDTTALAEIERVLSHLEALANPHVLQGFALEKHHKHTWFASEWTEGFSFRDLLRSRQMLRPDELFLLLPQTAEGIDAMLAAGVEKIEVKQTHLIVHFPDSSSSTSAFLRARVGEWPTFVVKIDALPRPRDFSSATFQGDQTVIPGMLSHSDIAGRIGAIRAFAVLAYEMLGGSSTLAAMGRFVPLAALNEKGNEALLKGIRKPDTFSSASEFVTDLASAQNSRPAAKDFPGAGSPTETRRSSASSQVPRVIPPPPRRPVIETSPQEPAVAESDAAAPAARIESVPFPLAGRVEWIVGPPEVSDFDEPASPALLDPAASVVIPSIVQPSVEPGAFDSSESVPVIETPQSLWETQDPVLPPTPAPESIASFEAPVELPIPIAEHAMDFPPSAPAIEEPEREPKFIEPEPIPLPEPVATDEAPAVSLYAGTDSFPHFEAAPVIEPPEPPAIPSDYPSEPPPLSDEQAEPSAGVDEAEPPVSVFPPHDPIEAASLPLSEDAERSATDVLLVEPHSVAPSLPVYHFQSRPASLPVVEIPEPQYSQAPVEFEQPVPASQTPEEAASLPLSRDAEPPASDVWQTPPAATGYAPRPVVARPFDKRPLIWTACAVVALLSGFGTAYLVGKHPRIIIPHDPLAEAQQSADSLEAQHHWPEALTLWMRIIQEYPASKIASEGATRFFDRLHGYLKDRPSAEFEPLRSLVSDASRRGIPAARSILSDDLRKVAGSRERNGQWTSAMEAWLQLTAEFPEGQGGSGGLELFFERLRVYLAGQPLNQFEAFRANIERASERRIPVARLMLADQLQRTASAWEANGKWAEALSSWLLMAKNYPEFPVGRNRVESLVESLRIRPGGLTQEQFDSIRPELTSAAELNYSKPQLLLGERLRTSEPATAFAWFCAAAANGEPVAMRNAGLMLAKGPATLHDPEKAFYYFEKASEKNEPTGSFYFSLCYLEGSGIHKDADRGLNLLKHASELGSAGAKNELGSLLHKGLVGLERDDNEAARYFLEAAKMGNPQALGNLGMMHMIDDWVAKPGEKRRVPKDKESGYEKLKEASDLGDAGSMYFRAQCLANGWGCPKNWEQAKFWYWKCRESGFKESLGWETILEKQPKSR